MSYYIRDFTVVRDATANPPDTCLKDISTIGNPDVNAGYLGRSTYIIPARTDIGADAGSYIQVLTTTDDTSAVNGPDLADGVDFHIYMRVIHDGGDNSKIHKAALFRKPNAAGPVSVNEALALGFNRVSTNINESRMNSRVPPGDYLHLMVVARKDARAKYSAAGQILPVIAAPHDQNNPSLSRPPPVTPGFECPATGEVESPHSLTDELSRCRGVSFALRPMTDCSTLEDLGGTTDHFFVLWQVLNLKCVFYILGGVTMLKAFVISFFLSDSPASACFLKPHMRVLALQRVAGNQLGIKNKKYKREQVIVAIEDPKICILFTAVFAAAIPNSLATFPPSSSPKTTLLKSVGDITQIVVLLIGGIITLNFRNTRLIASTSANIICRRFRRVHGVSPVTQGLDAARVVLARGLPVVGFAVSLVMVSSNMGGYARRTIASAVILWVLPD
ncbi:hypothetical protein C8R43DRAFT_1140434 [Mycena crocata]|nr:hypothetical protein C8R43DRAFT_1140434 [Mycena crocata]